MFRDWVRAIASKLTSNVKLVDTMAKYSTYAVAIITVLSLAFIMVAPYIAQWLGVI